MWAISKGDSSPLWWLKPPAFGPRILKEHRGERGWAVRSSAPPLDPCPETSPSSTSGAENSDFERSPYSPIVFCTARGFC